MEYLLHRDTSKTWLGEEVLREEEGDAKLKVVSVLCMALQPHTLTRTVLRRREGGDCGAQLPGWC